VLHELLPPGDLDFFTVFSSTSVLLPAAGQVDYIAANAFLDSLGASRKDGMAIRWGIWADRGMAARAYGAHAPAWDSPPLHPLLGVQVDAEDGAAFETLYDSRRLWALDEHRVSGRAVLPGTAYVEIAHAAMMVLHPEAAVELRALSLEEPMAFEHDARRIVRTELRRNGTGYDFTVRSRAPREEQWQEHARASASVFLGQATGQPAVSKGAWRRGSIAQEGVVAFGPRWHNIERMQLDAGRGCAELSLGNAFEADVATYRVHPALTDMGATFGLHLLDAQRRNGQVFVPMSVQRIRLLAPLPARVESRVQMQPATTSSVASFDASFHSPQGTVLATFEGFTLRAVGSTSFGSPVTRAPSSLVDEMLECGIRAEDAPALFERVLGSSARDLVVSSIDLDGLRRALAQARPAPVARPGPRAASSGTAALNPVEAVLAEAWRELLGVEQVQPADDFFALGGHSLAAVRLFARIRRHYEVDLPLATLFQAPTLGALAALVAQHAGIDLAEAAAPAKKSNVIPLGNRGWSPLVTICKGSAERTPLFCVHGAGGNVLNFKVISDRLGAAQPFYGLQAQGVDGRLQPLGSVEEMAAQYVEAIRTVQASGPYQLAGYSAGGVIALEMAHLLRRAGARVSLLAMIDTLSPAAARRKVSYARKLWLMRKWSLDFLLAWPLRRRKGKQADAEYAQALERLARGEPLPPELVEHHLFRNFVAAQARYMPQPYDGDMVLFKASQADTQYLGAGDALGWEAHVRGEIRVTEVGGSHFTMMAEPGVSQVIEALRKELGLPAVIEAPAAGSVLVDAIAKVLPVTERPV
jgi:thioesterase domain-containing protein/acyl carrier protein